jgi:hypothetical protein
MKKSFLLALCAVLVGISSTFAAGITGLNVDMAEFKKLHKSGYAIQLENGVDLAYYTDNHEYTFGIGGLTLASVDNTSYMTPGIFFRRNFAFTSDTVIGFGASVGTTIGKKSGVEFEGALKIKPYVFFEYAANPNVLLGASLALFESKTYSAGGTNSVEFLKGSGVQIAILF